MYSCLRVDMDLRGTALMPCSEQDTALSALVLDVLERVHGVGDAAQAGEAAETESPCVCSISRLVRNIRHSALTASRAIGRRRPPVQRSNGRGVLVHGAALLLRRHAGVSCYRSGVLLQLARLRVTLVLLGRRRAAEGLLWLLRLRVHLVLVELGLVRVLVVDGGLLPGHVGGLGVLVHGDTLLLHCDGSRV
jgi:hypothetical protein